jgi:hypothetical protein
MQGVGVGSRSRIIRMSSCNALTKEFLTWAKSLAQVSDPSR